MRSVPMASCSMYGRGSIRTRQLEQARARLRTMSDGEPIRFGQAAARLCRPEGNFGHAPRDVFVLQLQEACAECRRRHTPQPNFSRK